MTTYDKHDPEVAAAFAQTVASGIPEDDIESIEIDDDGLIYINWVVRRPRKWARLTYE